MQRSATRSEVCLCRKFSDVPGHQRQITVFELLAIADFPGLFDSLQCKNGAKQRPVDDAT